MLEKASYQRVLEIVHSTRQLSLPYFGRVEKLNFKNGDTSNIQTQIDLDIEIFLKQELEKVFPSIPFVGEELGGDTSADMFWLCDPIDGTSSFVRKLIYFTTMLSLIINGIVEFALIYDVINDDIYWAVRNNGTFCNVKRIYVSSRTWDQSSLIFETRNKDFSHFLVDNLSQRIDYKHSCAGYDYILIATGKIEGRIALKPYGAIWDYAPGCLLVEEAGGIVCNLQSDNYIYTNLEHIACNSEEVYLKIVEYIDRFYNTNILV